jgi:hypothetical protein
MLKRLYELFPREQVMVLIYERDIIKVERAYSKICSFLDVPAVPVDLNKTQGRGSVPNIAFPRMPGIVRDRRGRHPYWPGCAVIETMQDTAYYQADVVRRGAAKYKDFMRDLTWSIGHDEIATIHDELFAEDTELLKSILDDPLPEWDAIQQLKAPPRVQSRI